MNNNHDILIIALIVIIVGIQLLVFLSVFRRIKMFKRIFPDAYHFRAIRVYIPENRIADITPEEILDNLPKYGGSADGAQVDITEDDRNHDIAERQYENDEESDEITIGNGEWIEDEVGEAWMRNGNKELKVPVHLMRYYAEKGWKRIFPTDDDKEDLPF